MAEQSNILDIVKSKLIQAKTATTSADGRKAILKDVQKLLTQLDQIASTTNYNGVTLLQKSSTDTGATSAMSFQIGESSTNTISSTAARANTVSLGGGDSTLASGTDEYTLVNSTSSITSAASVKSGGTSVTIDTSNSSGVLDIAVSGKLGTMSGAVATLVVTDTEAINYLDGIALNADALSGTNGTYVFSGSTVNLGDFDFGSVEIDTTGNSSGLTFATTNTIQVTNNSTLTTATGDLTIASDASGVTGGNLLSNLKGLHEDSLTADLAGSYMATVDEAITQLNTTRSDFGSTQNQLDSAIRNMMTTQTNIKAAESVIRDVDYAAESANFNKQNIVAQAGTYAMSQANAIQQNVLRLLQ
jgi:flagellin